MSKNGKNVTQDYELMLNAYANAGGLPQIFKNSNIAHLVVHKNKVIRKNLVKGLILEPKETAYGVDIYLKVKKGIKIKNPVHLCFGVLPKEGIQEINIKAKIEDSARITLLAHCVFPNAIKIIHKMQAEIEIGNDAYYEYNEVHFHGESGGVEVIPKAKIKMGANSHLVTNFSLLKGRVGVFDLDYETEVLENSSLDMTAKIYGYGDDKIKIREAGYLKGKGSCGLIKSRIAVKDNATSQIINEILASAPQARGHIDCLEIIQGNASAEAIPIANVTNEFAKVTHEAAIGRVDKKQIETLMSRGLEEEEAINIVISGILK
ncbi:MAG: SufD family Fe-S cluster assembly protein [Candidatus Omnitrophica bacterium]|nr:SufD family Fe-S cluster assembly protein [Candidatus Omnitrophota bacterium]